MKNGTISENIHDVKTNGNFHHVIDGKMESGTNSKLQNYRKGKIQTGIFHEDSLFPLLLCTNGNGATKLYIKKMHGIQQNYKITGKDKPLHAYG